jgi:hypothetical protein
LFVRNGLLEIGWPFAFGFTTQGSLIQIRLVQAVKPKRASVFSRRMNPLRLTVRDPTAVEPQWNADRQVYARNRFARCAVLEMVLLDRAAFNVMFQQDIARRVASRGGRGNYVILELLECGRTSVAMRSADDSFIDTRKLLKEPIAERPKSDFAADRIDGPAIERNRTWSGHQRNVVTACVAAHVDANTVTIVLSVERMEDKAGLDGKPLAVFARKQSEARFMGRIPDIREPPGSRCTKTERDRQIIKDDIFLSQGKVMHDRSVANGNLGYVAHSATCC